MKLVTTKFKTGGLHEKHVVATWNPWNHLSICLQTQGNQEKPVSRWPVAGSSKYWLLVSSPAFTVLFCKPAGSFRRSLIAQACCILITTEKSLHKPRINKTSRWPIYTFFAITFNFYLSYATRDVNIHTLSIVQLTATSESHKFNGRYETYRGKR
jgi:hypothetical protein